MYTDKHLICSFYVNVMLEGVSIVNRLDNSASIQSREVVWPLCSRGKSKALELEVVVDGCVVCQTYMREW